MIKNLAELAGIKWSAFQVDESQSALKSESRLLTSSFNLQKALNMFKLSSSYLLSAMAMIYFATSTSAVVIGARGTVSPFYAGCFALDTS